MEQYGRPYTTCSTTTCPDITGCPQEFIAMDENGCCQICQETSHGCSAVLKEGHPQKLKVGICESIVEVNVTECEGRCGSSTSVLFPDDYSQPHTYQENCNCCKPTKTERRQVDMVCEDFTQVVHEYDVIMECSCEASQCVQWSQP